MSESSQTTTFNFVSFIPSSLNVSSHVNRQNKIRFFHGTSIENPKESYAIMIPTATPAYGDSLSGTVQQLTSSGLAEKIINSLKGELLMDTLERLLSSPVVEIARITLKESIDASQIAPYLDIITGFDTPTVLASKWITTSDSKVLLMLVGWVSLEAHKEVNAKPTPEFNELLEKLLALSNLEITHASFKEVV